MGWVWRHPLQTVLMRCFSMKIVSVWFYPRTRKFYKPTVSQMIIIVLCPLTRPPSSIRLKKNLKGDFNSWTTYKKRFQRRSRRSSVAQSTSGPFQYSKKLVNWIFQPCRWIPKRLSGNNAIVNKLKTVPMNHLILRENLLVDQDLAYFNMKELVIFDLSLNFLQKPAQLKGMCPDAVDLSYNPIDFDWIISNAAYITKSSLNLIGCFNSVSFNWKELGKSLRFVKKLEISLPPFWRVKFRLFWVCELSESTKLEGIVLVCCWFPLIQRDSSWIVVPLTLWNG